MLFRRNCGCLLGVIGICLLISGPSSRGSIESRADLVKRWRDLGRRVLYQSGSGRGPSAAWLDRELDAVDPDSGEAVSIAEALLTEAFAAFGQEAIVLEGRIPLDINPQCILGLYVAGRFSGTRLGAWGRRRFQQCVEQAYLAAIPVAGGTWRAQLEAEVLAMDGISRGPLQAGAFKQVEAPCLYFYLIDKAQSTNAQSKARACLARYLWQEYGLEPGLRQYLVLLDEGCRVDGTWLEVAGQSERLGARTRAKRIYKEILVTTDSLEKARQAFEALAAILLAESQPGQARAAWGVFSERFPNGVCEAPAIRQFLDSFAARRAQTSKRFAAELAQTGNGVQALQLCRRFDALWTADERASQWQTVVEGVPAGSLADQFSRVFLAWALLAVGQAPGAEGVVRGLPRSVDAFVQAQRLAVLAEIAQAAGDLAECVRLYGQALRIDRPSVLPSWSRPLVRVEPADGASSDLERQRLFLRGCHHLIDGAYARAAASLHRAAAEAGALPHAVRGVLPGVLLLACLGAEDYVEAEGWGRQVLAQYHGETPDDPMLEGLKTDVARLDTAVFALLAMVRDASRPAAASVVSEQALRLCEAGVTLGLSGSYAGLVQGGLQELYVRAKKHLMSRLLIAEYHCARQRWLARGEPEPFLSIEPLFFAGQVLRDAPFARIRDSLLSVPTDAEQPQDRLCRFARFALKAKRPDLATRALHAGPGEPLSAGAVEVLEDIAEMYLASSNHHKAIETYERIVANSKDPSKDEAIRFRIIEIYVEDLKSYDKAIQQCEAFIQRHPDSAQICQMEFLIGKLSYISKNYAGAAAQLDGFQTRYPEHPQVGQAMLLVGLSRMAEGNTQEAIGRFIEIIRRYPDSDLAARSKFLIGYAQVSEQQYAMALETFKQLIEQFPQSQYVQQAHSLIDRLSKVSQ